jgi:hypothetical protein
MISLLPGKGLPHPGSVPKSDMDYKYPELASITHMFEVHCPPLDLFIHIPSQRLTKCRARGGKRVGLADGHVWDADTTDGQSMSWMHGAGTVVDERLLDATFINNSIPVASRLAPD